MTSNLPNKKLLLKQHFFEITAVIFSLLAIISSFFLPSQLLFRESVKASDLPLIFVIIIIGMPLLVQIALDLLKKNWGADFLAAIALVTAFILKEYLAATLIILMLAGGKALEDYAMRKASKVLNALAERMPLIAHRKNGEHIEDIPLDQIKIGDYVIVFPHEVSPVDGIVVDGHGSMDESYLTGEPYRLSKAPGAYVLSGAINGESVLTIQAEKYPKDSRYAGIMKVMSEAEQKKPQLRRLADQLGIFFAPIALIIALLTWFFTSDPDRFLAVLVIATPCPLLIAIPITIISAISIAARKSIIIKDPTVLERLPTCKTAIFDKTGTLTYGKPELTEIVLLHDYSREHILQLAASLERYSKHPLSSAILQAAKKEKLALIEAQAISEKPGQGLKGIVSHHKVQITHRYKLADSSILPPESGGLECVILVDNKVSALCRFRDMPRKEGHAFIQHLGPSHHFDKIMLLSGDRPSEVLYLAKELGISETFSNQTPEQKVEIVRHECEKGPTLFMGDGVNDAPALATATVGIAFGQGSAVTSEAAGAVILESTLLKVDELLHLSLAFRRIALQSGLGGIFLSIFGMGFAVLGFITPVMGALLQEVIDVLAILNALRLAWKTDIRVDFE